MNGAWWEKYVPFWKESAYLLVVNHDQLVHDKLESEGGNLRLVGLRDSGTNWLAKISSLKRG